VTTTAEAIKEMQTVVLSSIEGYTIGGNFTLRFPEVQSIKVKSITVAAMDTIVRQSGIALCGQAQLDRGRDRISGLACCRPLWACRAWCRTA
jgi:hypothetical protein